MARLFRQKDVALEYELLAGKGPVTVFLPGFASNMAGTKAMMLHDACVASGRAMLRLDYAGHGISGGQFTEGSIGDWTEDAAAVIEAACGVERLVLVGSSMGGWIALLLALKLGARVKALLLVAPAPDFTETLILPRLTAAQREALEREGAIQQPSEYGEPTPITRKLLEDGKRHLLLGGPIAVDCPVRVLHGMNDDDVPWEVSVQLARCLRAADVRLIFVKDGDHRLSRPQDLALLRDAWATLLGEDGA